MRAYSERRMIHARSTKFSETSKGIRLLNAHIALDPGLGTSDPKEKPARSFNHESRSRYLITRKDRPSTSAPSPPTLQPSRRARRQQFHTPEHLRHWHSSKLFPPNMHERPGNRIPRQDSQFHNPKAGPLPCPPTGFGRRGYGYGCIVWLRLSSTCTRRL
ncbi:hypothetical protein K432DRAFT_147373 [Lepidopterella palustris CBS 459.81]|uniref:Uncharacterized protein n=1 Tax=Lepidopterella palustris CBS 459.81 TaxID=1314670 RepID=A0A8E2EHF8_9PEZI|nr:hypothetical protein K432DRAFT_147373 [Lepidopterella palustris CBS 459.81]